MAPKTRQKTPTPVEHADFVAGTANTPVPDPTGMSPATTAMAEHLAGHLRSEPELAGRAIEEYGEYQPLPYQEALARVRRMTIDKVNELHARAHRATCGHCGQPVLSHHVTSEHHPIWRHENGEKQCLGRDDHAAPDRHAHMYATVTVAHRVELPRHLGSNPHPDTIEAWFEDNYVSYLTDDLDGESSVGNIVDVVTIVSDVDDTVTVEGWAPSP